MQSYAFRIQKADHVGDLHVHVYFNQRKSRRLLGRYRVPTLEPIFPKEPELNQTEIGALRGWLAQPEQLRRLTGCLKSSVFDMHRVAGLMREMGDVVEGGGETYMAVRIPVSRRIGQ